MGEEKKKELICPLAKECKSIHCIHREAHTDEEGDGCCNRECNVPKDVTGLSKPVGKCIEEGSGINRKIRMNLK